MEPGGQEFGEEFHIDFAEDVEIEDNGRVPFEIVGFKEGTMKNMEVSGVLKESSGTVLGVVKLLEKLGRKRELSLINLG